MKIQLPLENWVDLLPFVPRFQLVEIVKQLGDRQFAKILQFFLTEVGQITFEHLRIEAPDPNGGGPIVEVDKISWPIGMTTNLPEGPMPTNVKDFKRIDLSGDMHNNMFSWCDWLYSPRDDVKPRVLRFCDSSPYSKNLIEQIKKDFLKATRQVNFFVYVQVFGDGNVHWQDIDICLDNGQTNERLRLVVKTIDSQYFPEKRVLISRYPVAANQEWIETNEQEIIGWDFHKQNRRIRFERSLGQNDEDDNV